MTFWLVSFWVCLVSAVYSYVIYALILRALPGRPAAPAWVGGEPPLVSVIITVHNEAGRVADKLANTLAVDYPRARLEILVASDASTDATNDIVRGFALQGVILVEVGEHLGKEHAQKMAIAQSRGEILVFTDAAARIAEDSLQRIVEVIADPKVGALSSVDRFVTESGQLVGEGAYVRYEMWLRDQESRVHSLVGLSGSFFAARRVVCETWDINSPSDFNTAINCVRQGFVAVSGVGIYGFYPDIKNPKGEYRRKLRTALRGMTGMFRNLDMLNPLHYPLFAFELFSHKLMRWLVPWFMLGLLVASIVVWSVHWFYALALAGQVAFYAVALLAWVFEGLRASTAFRIVFYFVQVNIALAHALVLFILGKRITVWEPSKR